MKRYARTLAALALLVLSATTAKAQYLSAPKPGFFWNPGEPGKGWALEVQDNLVFIASYTFQPTGNQSVFYTTLGTWDGINKRGHGRPARVHGRAMSQLRAVDVHFTQPGFDHLRVPHARQWHGCVPRAPDTGRALALQVWPRGT